MRSISTLFAALVLAACVSVASAQTPSYLTVLNLNDTHSNLAAGAPRDGGGNATVGGIARAAAVIGMERTVDPNALVLHAGDVFIGDPAFNFSMTTMEQPELMMLVTLGVDAMTVGNHEFDLGADALVGCLAASFPTAGFPLLSANLDYSQQPDHPLQNYVSPHMVTQAGDLKVGIFGMTATEVEITQTAYPIMVSGDVFTIAAQEVAALEAEGCDVIIFLSHLGYMYDMAVAASVPGINLIVGGHDHYALSQAVELDNGQGTTWIVQSGAFYRSMGKTRLKVENGTVTLDEYTLITLDETVPEEPQTKAACDALYMQLDQAMNGLLFTAVGMSTGELTEWIPDCTVPGNLDTHVGNLCADAFAAATGADFAIQPGGSTAQPIYQGPVTALDLFRCIGYGMNAENGIGFGIVTVDMTGEAIRAAIEVSLSLVPLSDEYLFHPSDALYYSFNPMGPDGARLLSLDFNGAPMEDGTTYTMAINELLLAYTDYFQSIDPRITYTNLTRFDSMMGPGPLTELEALTGYVAAVQPLSPDPLPGRITSVLVPVEDIEARPAAIELSQNYPNPFTESTSMRMTLPTRAHATVAVYDAMGRRVAVLADREFEAGTHSLRLRADELPAGLYFCRLLSGNVQRTVRMLHTK